MSEVLRYTMPVMKRWGVGHGDAVYHLIFTRPQVPRLGEWLFEVFHRAHTKAGLQSPPRAPSAIPDAVLRQRISPFKPCLVLCRNDAAAGRVQFGARAALFSLEDMESITLVVGSDHSVGFNLRGAPAELATLPATVSDDLTLDLLRAVVEIAGFFESRLEYVESA